MFDVTVGVTSLIECLSLQESYLDYEVFMEHLGITVSETNLTQNYVIRLLEDSSVSDILLTDVYKGFSCDNYVFESSGFSVTVRNLHNSVQLIIVDCDFVRMG